MAPHWDRYDAALPSKYHGSHRCVRTCRDQAQNAWEQRAATLQMAQMWAKALGLAKATGSDARRERIGRRPCHIQLHTKTKRDARDVSKPSLSARGYLCLA